MALLIVFGNVTDYYMNYHFVEHVMKMDTIFPDSRVHYRSIESPWFYNASYIFLIALEAVMAFCCMKGTWQMFRNIRHDTYVFHASKNWAVAGIGIGVMIWFLGFETIGGEWFAMWQSSTWNGLNSAERILNFLVLTLILLHLEEKNEA